MSRFRKALFQAASSALRPPSLLGAGSVAPEFELLAHDGSQVRSSDLLGTEHYVLVFYPGDDTPGCSMQLQAFSQMAERFAEQDCRVFGVNPADAGSHCRFIESKGLTVSLLVDSDRRLAVDYHTARSSVPVTFRSVFLVDKKGIVRSAMKDMPDPEAVLALVTRCNETGYKGTGRKGRQAVPEVSSYGLRKVLSNEAGARILDIREEVDWRAGHIGGSLNIPIDDLKDRLAELPDERTPLVICCTQGLRATGAAHILSEAGWRKLYTLTDGMEAYRGDLEKSSEG